MILEYLKQYPDYKQRFKYTLHPGESFFHTLLLNVPLDTKIENTSLRYTFSKNKLTPNGLFDGNNPITPNCIFGVGLNDCLDQEDIDQLYLHTSTSFSEKIIEKINAPKYIHGENVHNLIAPRIIVPEIIKLLSPESVVDVGCGLGTFLFSFKELGVKNVLGIDGSWVNKDLLANYLSLEKEFLEKDLEKPLNLDKEFDVAICLEVAEHLNEENSDILVNSLTSLSKAIVFSAAIPNQGGQNHINCQWLSYWRDKFEKSGYEFYDVFRPIIWNDPNVFWWYKQNMVLILHHDHKLAKTLEGFKSNTMLDVVHPEWYLAVSK